MSRVNGETAKMELSSKENAFYLLSNYRKADMTGLPVEEIFRRKNNSAIFFVDEGGNKLFALFQAEGSYKESGCEITSHKRVVVSADVAFQLTTEEGYLSDVLSRTLHLMTELQNSPQKPAVIDYSPASTGYKAIIELAK